MERPPAHVDPQRPDPQLLLWAYGQGLFPMADPYSDRIEWFSPDPRGIMPLDTFHVPRSLAREVRRGRFCIRIDTAFDAVIQACAEPRRDDQSTWINEELTAAYVGLFRLGNAHSVEAWREDHLVGGLYGVHIGGAFFGESMFCRADLGGTNASKVCLVHLVQHLRRRGFTLLDTQFWNEHLGRFGCVEIPAREYLRRLAEAIRRDVRWEESD